MLTTYQMHFSIGMPCRNTFSLLDSTQLGVCEINRRSTFYSSSIIHTCAHVACRNPDAYHTAYCISGLSAAQHHVFPSPTRREEVRSAWNGEDGVRATAFAESLCWIEEDGRSHIVGSAANRVVRRFLLLR